MSHSRSRRKARSLGEIAIRLSLLMTVILFACIRDSSGTDIGEPADQDALPKPEDVGQDPEEVKEFIPGPNPKNVPLYDEDRVLSFHLEMNPADWKKIEDYQQARAILDAGGERYVPCSFRFEKEFFEKAACRRKANPKDWDGDIKPQIVVRFNKWDKEARFLGLRRINLEGSPGAEAPVRDRLAMWLMRNSGLDASRVNHTVVHVNGQSYGLYQNIEPVDREFLEDHFADPSGNLYDGGSELKTNEELGDESDRRAWRDLILNEPLDGDHSAFYSELQSLMDVSQVLRLMAAERVLPTSSNFTNGYSNFYLYNIPGPGFVIIPWDIDSLFNGNCPPDADPYVEDWIGGGDHWRLKLQFLLIDNPAWREEFDGYIAQIRDDAYARLSDQAAFYCAQIREYVEADEYRTAPLDEFDAYCTEIKSRIQQRIKFLQLVLEQ